MSHTVLVILGGLLLLVCLYGGASMRGIALRRAFPVFAIVWAGLAVFNLWVGVTRAGYSVAEELPILGVVFLVPVGIAWVVARWRG